MEIISWLYCRALQTHPFKEPLANVLDFVAHIVLAGTLQFYWCSRKGAMSIRSKEVTRGCGSSLEEFVNPSSQGQATVNIRWQSSCFWSNMGQTAVLTMETPPGPPSLKQRLVSVHGTLEYISYLQLLSFLLTHSIPATARALLFLEHARPALPQIICAAWCFCHNWSCSSYPQGQLST